MEANNALVSLRTEAIEKLEMVRTAISGLTAQCNNIVITDAETLQIAVTLAKSGKKIEDLIENKRKEITAPILEEKKMIDDHAKSLIADLNKAVQVVRDQIKGFELKERQKQEAIRLELLQQQRKLEEELRNSVKADTEEDLSVKSQELAAMKEVSAQMVQAPKTQNGVTIALSWDFEIQDANLVPVQYMIIDERKIKAAISAGVREIKGVKIFQKETLKLK